MEFKNKDIEQQYLERLEDDRQVLEDNTTEEESQIRAQTLWEQILTKIQEETLSEGACNRWLRPAQALNLTDQALTVRINDFNKSWIETHYSDILAEAIRNIIGKELPIIFKTDGWIVKSIPGPKQEWMCTACGQKELRYVSAGRPLPGNCPQEKGDKPHSWTVNRKM